VHTTEATPGQTRVDKKNLALSVNSEALEFIRMAPLLLLWDIGMKQKKGLLLCCTQEVDITDCAHNRSNARANRS
jgi:hypothetical protein